MNLMYKYCQKIVYFLDCVPTKYAKIITKLKVKF